MAAEKNSKKTTGWSLTGDSMEGIKNLRPDILKQRTDNTAASKVQQKSVTKALTTGAVNTKKNPQKRG